MSGATLDLDFIKKLKWYCYYGNTKAIKDASQSLYLAMVGQLLTRKEEINNELPGNSCRD